MVTTFHVADNPTENHVISQSDPVTLRLSNFHEAMSEEDGRASLPSCLQVQEIQYRVKGVDVHNFDLVKLLYVSESYEITEILFRRLKNNDETTSTSWNGIPVPKDVRPRSQRMVDDEELKEFIVDESGRGEQGGSDRPPPFPSLDHKPLTKVRLDYLRRSHSVDFRKVYEMISGMTVARSNFSEDINAMRESLITASEARGHMKLLINLLPSATTSMLDSVEENEEELWAFGEEISHIPNLELVRVLRQDVRTLEVRHSIMMLSKLYEHLQSLFLEPLAADVPSRFRISKDRIIREVTTRLVLSSSAVVRSLSSNMSRSDRSDSADRRQSGSQPESSPGLLPQDRRMYSPTMERKNSGDNSAWHASPSARTDVVAASIARLQHFTSVGVGSSQMSIPLSISRVLSHLPSPILSSEDSLPNPSTYSYARAKQLHSAPVPSSVQRTEAEARRDARAERRRKRQQEQIESSQRSKAPPSLIVSDQPAPMPMSVRIRPVQAERATQQTHGSNRDRSMELLTHFPPQASHHGTSSQPATFQDSGYQDIDDRIMPHLRNSSQLQSQSQFNSNLGKQVGVIRTKVRRKRPQRKGREGF